MHLTIWLRTAIAVLGLTMRVPAYGTGVADAITRKLPSAYMAMHPSIPPVRSAVHAFLYRKNTY